MAPPRGVLLYGAPGTGKTLIARALAASCSRAGAEVSFYMRKGADVLSKWVGESERQLRLLFAEAQKRQPSIIFFDEIDGLAPVRSSKTDQIHNSIVATLLALMDGLDSRGRVVVLGATNRVDAVDGALRRPGRFDRELAFPLPSVSARAEILRIHTRAWEKKPSDEILDQLAQKCVGYCGADLKALCTEAAVHALRRRYPQIYESDDKLLIDPGRVVPNRADFRAAMDAITPASHRSAQAHARPLGPLRAPLLGPTLDELVEATKTAFPPFALAATANDEGDGSGGGDGDGGVFGLSPEDSDSDSEDDDAILRGSAGDRSTSPARRSRRPLARPASARRVAALVPWARPRPRRWRRRRSSSWTARSPGRRGCSSRARPARGQTPLGAALLHELEAFPVHAVGLPSLLADGGRTPEEALVGAVTEARRAAPAILFLPHLRLWWDSAPPSLRAVLRALLEDVPGDLPLMLLATCDCEREALDEDAAGLFGEDQVVELRPPSAPARRAYLGAVATAAARRAGSDLKAADARAAAAAARREEGATTNASGGGSGEGAGAHRRRIRGGARGSSRPRRLRLGDGFHARGGGPRVAAAEDVSARRRHAASVSRPVERVPRPRGGGGGARVRQGGQGADGPQHAPVARGQRVVPHRGGVPSRRSAHRRRRQDVLGRRPGRGGRRGERQEEPARGGPGGAEGGQPRARARGHRARDGGAARPGARAEVRRHREAPRRPSGGGEESAGGTDARNRPPRPAVEPSAGAPARRRRRSAPRRLPRRPRGSAGAPGAGGSSGAARFTRGRVRRRPRGVGREARRKRQRGATRARGGGDGGGGGGEGERGGGGEGGGGGRGSDG